MKKRRCQYFIWTDPGTETNQKLGEYLASKGLVAEAEGEIDFNGHKLRGWLVKHEIVTDLAKSAKVFGFKFRVYVKRGGCDWQRSFIDQPRKRLSVHSKAARVRLKEIGARK